MAITLTFDNPINVSTQVGDKIYGVAPGTTSVDNTNLIGIVDNIPNNLQISVDDTTGVYTVSPNDFIMFQKDNRINTTSLKGYHAVVRLENVSADKVELFSVGSEISESSK